MDILAKATALGESFLGPRAEATDRGEVPLGELFARLADSGLAGLSIPPEYGGLGAPSRTQRDLTETLAAWCGVTAFTHAQHQSACRLIADGPNESLRSRLLPDLAAGRTWCAIAFAHLRRPGPPVLTAKPVDGGWRIDGTAPWVTGWGLMNQIVVAATLPDGRHGWYWSPLDQPGLRPSAPMQLCAMTASATVQLTFEDCFIPQDCWLMESDASKMREQDQRNVLAGASLPLGCAAGAIRTLAETGRRRELDVATETAASMQRELDVLRAAVRSDEGALQTRVAAIDLARRAAHAAVAAASGSANMLTHPAQRLAREAMFYSVQAQTREILEATLHVLKGDTP